MPSCFAPGCKSGYCSTRRKNKKNGLKNPSLFSVPKDAILLEKWNRSIPRKDRDIVASDKVCELHFPEDCIERNFITKLPDGTDSVIEREIPLLKKGSIPTLFPNLPAYFSTTTSQRKPPTARNFKINKSKKTEVTDAEENSDNLQYECQDDPFNYMHLIQHLEQVQKPNLWWIVSFCQEYAVCSKWDQFCSTERRVIVYQDLTTKIFLKDVEVPSLSMKLGSIESLSLLLQKIDALNVCQVAESGLPLRISRINAIRQKYTDENKFSPSSIQKGKANKAEELQPLKRKKSKGMPSTTIEADLPSTAAPLEDFVLISNKSENFSDTKNLESLQENNFNESHDGLQSTCTDSYSNPNNFNESLQIKYVTHLEAISAAKTLLHYMINQDDVNNADINFILSMTKKIGSRLPNLKTIKSEYV